MCQECGLKNHGEERVTLQDVNVEQRSWDGLPFYTLNHLLRREFGEKIFKVCLDGGFSCPNRDGTVGSQGCLFCDERGAGFHAGLPDQLLADQLAAQLHLLAGKWVNRRFVAFFQNFTATYAPLERLEKLYGEALALPGAVGLAVATRPDCLRQPVVELLHGLSQNHLLWVELGLQTAHDHTAALIGRGYSRSVFARALQDLRDAGVGVVVHVIFGLPGESHADMLATIDYLAGCDIQGIKLHSLHVHRETRLANLYERGGVRLLDKEEYIVLAADAVERLPTTVAIHRLTGDGTRSRLVAPLWSLEKKRVYTGIVGELRRRGTWHGCRTKSV